MMKYITNVHNHETNMNNLGLYMQGNGHVKVTRGDKLPYFVQSIIIFYIIGEILIKLHTNVH